MHGVQLTMLGKIKNGGIFEALILGFACSAVPLAIMAVIKHFYA